MPSALVILAAVVGAINVRLVAPLVMAFLGTGKWSVARQRDSHLIT
jgi:hypothetical protein